MVSGSLDIGPAPPCFDNNNPPTATACGGPLERIGCSRSLPPTAPVRLSIISGRSGHRPSWLSGWADDGLFTFGSFSTLAPPLSHALPGCAAPRVTRKLGHSVTLSCVLQKYFRRMHMEPPMYDSVPN